MGLALLGGKIFSPDELFFQAVRDPNPWFISYPWRTLVRLCFSAGEFPLWNPYNVLGEPFLANYQQAVFSPFRWPFYFLPFRLVIVPLIVSELSLAGLGAWLFAKRLKLSDLSAFVCGAGYMLSGYLVQYLNNQHLPIDMLLPYGLLLADRLAERQSRRNFFLTALVIALILLGGQPESALFNLGLVFLYFLFKCREQKRFFQPAAVLLGVSGLALMFCLIQLLPFLEAIPQSWTFHPQATAAQHLALQTFGSIMAPGLFGPTNLAPVPIQRIFPWIGTVLVFLSLIAIFNQSRLPPSPTECPRKKGLRRTGNALAHLKLFLFIFALIGLGITYGLPGFNLITRLPGLDRLVWMKYLQPAISFSLVMLAGIGFEQTRNLERRVKIFPALLLGFLILLGGFLCSLFAFPPPRKWEMVSLLFSGWLLIFAFVFARIRKGWAGVGLILLIALEPIAYHHLLDRPSFWINMEKADLSRFRKLQAQNPGARFAAEPRVWFPNLMQAAPIYDLGLNDALIPKRYVSLVKYLNQYASEDEQLTDYFSYHSLRLRESAFNFPVARILAAKFFLRKSAPKVFLPWESERGFWIPGKDGLTPHYTLTALYGDPVYVLPIPDSLPRIFFPERLSRYQGNPEVLLQFLARLNLAEEAVVETGQPVSGLSRAEILQSDYRPSGISIVYRSEGKAFMVLSEQYFPGWRAYLINDKSETKIADKSVGAPKQELRIYQTDYLLRGVFLEPGSRRLLLVYQPWGFRIGLYSCLGSLLFLLMAAGFSAVRPRPGPARSAS